MAPFFPLEHAPEVRLLYPRGVEEAGREDPLRKRGEFTTVTNREFRSGLPLRMDKRGLCDLRRPSGVCCIGFALWSENFFAVGPAQTLKDRTRFARE